MNFLRIVMSSCLPWMATLGVSDVLPISDRFLRLRDDACVTRSLTGTHHESAGLTMQIGYRLDTDVDDTTLTQDRPLFFLVRSHSSLSR